MGIREGLLQFLKFNPHHEPAGTPVGGRFAHGPSGTYGAALRAVGEVLVPSKAMLTHSPQSPSFITSSGELIGFGKPYSNLMIHNDVALAAIEVVDEELAGKIRKDPRDRMAYMGVPFLLRDGHLRVATWDAGQMLLELAQYPTGDQLLTLKSMFDLSVRMRGSVSVGIDVIGIQGMGQIEPSVIEASEGANIESWPQFQRLLQKAWNQTLTKEDIEKYDPSQPRAPAGDPNGGQWVATGNSVQSEQDVISLERRFGKLKDGTYISDGAGLKAPNTAAFRQWFSGSKVVDVEGRPLIAFHGSRADITEFRVPTYADKAGRTRNPHWTGDLGMFFTAPPPNGDGYDVGNAEFMAAEFSHGNNDVNPSEADLKRAQGASVYPVFLRILNPYEVENYEDIVDTMQEMGMSGPSFRAWLQKQGHDGIVIRGSMTDGDVLRDDWIAFSRTQIKSALGNRGTFDLMDPDITKHGDGSHDEKDHGNWADGEQAQTPTVNPNSKTPGETHQQHVERLLMEGILEEDDLEWIKRNSNNPLQEQWLVELLVDQQEFQANNPDKVGCRVGEWDRKGTPVPEQSARERLMSAATGMWGTRLHGGGIPIAKFIARNGEVFKVPKAPPQTELGYPKECYSNAARMVMHEIGEGDLTYAEGYVLSSDMPNELIHHAWLVNKQGEVVDPTLGWSPSKTYIGVKMPTREMRKAVFKAGVFGITAGGSVPQWLRNYTLRNKAA